RCASGAGPGRGRCDDAAPRPPPGGDGSGPFSIRAVGSRLNHIPRWATSGSEPLPIRADASKSSHRVAGAGRAESHNRRVPRNRPRGSSPKASRIRMQTRLRRSTAGSVTRSFRAPPGTLRLPPSHRNKEPRMSQPTDRQPAPAGAMDRRAFLRHTAAGAALAAGVPGALHAAPALARGEGQGGRGAPAPPRGWQPQPFELEEATIAQLQEWMREGRYTARAITELYLRRIEELDRQGPALRHVLETNPDALEIADRLDAERRAGRVRGP